MLSSSTSMDLNLSAKLKPKQEEIVITEWLMNMIELQRLEN